MSISQQQINEIELLLKFPTDSMMHGLKIHHDAEPKTIEAAASLFSKGITTQVDGGYLTDLGLDLIEHAQKLFLALK